MLHSCLNNAEIKALLASKDETIALLRQQVDDLQLKLISVCDPAAISALRVIRGKPSAQRRHFKPDPSTGQMVECSPEEAEKHAASVAQGMRELGIIS